MNSLYAILDRLGPYVLSILRVIVSLLFLQHGLAKMIGIPIPEPQLMGLLPPAANIEVVGSALLLVGIYTRIVALIMSVEMALVYFMVRSAKSFYPLVNGGELEVLFCILFFYLAFTGAGPWSVDRLAKIP